MKPRNIVITGADMTRLRALVESSLSFRKHDQEHLQKLGEELDLATVFEGDRVPRDVVTMNARVRVTDLDTGAEHVFQIVFPRDADIAKNRISVLAPIGTALLGYRAGDHVEWKVPGGTRRFRVDRVEYQPEAQAPAGLLARRKDRNLRIAG